MKVKHMLIGKPVKVKTNATQALGGYVGRHGVIHSLGIMFDTCYVQFEPNGLPIIAKADELKRRK